MQGRPVLRRRHANALTRDAEQPGPHPVHRHDSRRADAWYGAVLARRCSQIDLAQESLRGHRGLVHRLHGLHARDAVPAALLPPARRHRRGRDRDVVGPEPRRHAGAHRDALAVLGPARRSLRPQDHGRALARQLRLRHGGDGVRHAGRGTSSRCARSRGSSPATAR